MSPGRRAQTVRVLRVAVVIVALGLAVHLLLPRVTELRATITALHHASAAWLVGAFAVVISSYPASALSLIGAAGRRLPFRRTTAVEFAGTFLNRLTPAGIGRTGVLGRYLVVAGVSPLETAGVVGLNLAAGMAVHGVGLVVVAALVHPSSLNDVDLPDRWADLLTAVGVFAAAGAVIAAVALRRRWRGIVERVAPLRQQLRRALSHPGWLVALVVGVVLVNLAMIVALDMSLVAFGAHPSLDVVALVYLGGSAVAALAPTPGGLGAMEAALVAGLTALGVSPGPAIAGALGFRLLSWWAPGLVGGVAWIALRRRGTL